MMNRHSRALALTLVISGLVSTAYAQTDKIDDYVKAQMDAQKIPGLSIAVVRNGEIVRAKGYGLANVELNVPARPGTVYQSGAYQLAPGLIWNITSSADQLWMQATVLPELQRFPELNFFLTGANVQMKFVKDTSLKVTAVVLHRDCNAEQVTN